MKRAINEDLDHSLIKALVRALCNTDNKPTKVYSTAMKFEGKQEQLKKFLIGLENKISDNKSCRDKQNTSL
jgi:hypothetical protein